MSGEKMSNTEKIKFIIWDLDNTIHGQRPGPVQPQKPVEKIQP
jgi:hypothetical protein